MTKTLPPFPLEALLWLVIGAAVIEGVCILVLWRGEVKRRAEMAGRRRRWLGMR